MKSGKHRSCNLSPSHPNFIFGLQEVVQQESNISIFSFFSSWPCQLRWADSSLSESRHLVTVQSAMPGAAFEWVDRSKSMAEVDLMRKRPTPGHSERCVSHSWAGRDELDLLWQLRGTDVPVGPNTKSILLFFSHTLGISRNEAMCRYQLHSNHHQFDSRCVFGLVLGGWYRWYS